MAERNRIVLAGLIGLAATMTAAAYAAVPFYRWFCQVTGYAGTMRRADTVPRSDSASAPRRITVRFNADVNRNVPWRFRPLVPKLTVALGEGTLAAFQAENRSTRPMTGTAVFNVTPWQAGRYINKVECFCFSEQRLQPAEHVDLPVYFFVDPAIADDPDLGHVDTVTLSYTFFRSASEDGTDG